MEKKEAITAIKTLSKTRFEGHHLTIEVRLK